MAQRRLRGRHGALRRSGTRRRASRCGAASATPALDAAIGAGDPSAVRLQIGVELGDVPAQSAARLLIDRLSPISASRTRWDRPSPPASTRSRRRSAPRRALKDLLAGDWWSSTTPRSQLSDRGRRAQRHVHVAAPACSTTCPTAGLYLVYWGGGRCDRRPVTFSLVDQSGRRPVVRDPARRESGSVQGFSWDETTKLSRMTSRASPTPARARLQRRRVERVRQPRRRQRRPCAQRRRDRRAHQQAQAANANAFRAFIASLRDRAALPADGDAGLRRRHGEPLLLRAGHRRVGGAVVLRQRGQVGAGPARAAAAAGGKSAVAAARSAADADYRYRLERTETDRRAPLLRRRLRAERPHRSRAIAAGSGSTRRTFLRLKVQTIQTHLEGPIVSSEETTTYEPVPTGEAGRPPAETAVHQADPARRGAQPPAREGTVVLRLPDRRAGVRVGAPGRARQPPRHVPRHRRRRALPGEARRRARRQRRHDARRARRWRWARRSTRRSRFRCRSSASTISTSMSRAAATSWRCCLAASSLLGNLQTPEARADAVRPERGFLRHRGAGHGSALRRRRRAHQRARAHDSDVDRREPRLSVHAVSEALGRLRVALRRVLHARRTRRTDFVVPAQHGDARRQRRIRVQPARLSDRRPPSRRSRVNPGPRGDPPATFEATGGRTDATRSAGRRTFCSVRSSRSTSARPGTAAPRLDRFSMYQFGLFDEVRMHGVPCGGHPIPRAGARCAGRTRSTSSASIGSTCSSIYARGRDPNRRDLWRSVTGTGVARDLQDAVGIRCSPPTSARAGFPTSIAGRRIDRATVPPSQAVLTRTHEGRSPRALVSLGLRAPLPVAARARVLLHAGRRLSRGQSARDGPGLHHRPRQHRRLPRVPRPASRRARFHRRRRDLLPRAGRARACGFISARSA